MGSSEKRGPQSPALIKTNKQLTEIEALTGLRGVAALYVVLHHYFANGSFSNEEQTFVTHGYLAVDLFFILSGFVMALNYSHLFFNGFSVAAYRIFMARRFARVYPIYFLTTLVAFLLIIAGLNENISVEISSPEVWVLKLGVNALLIQGWGIAASLNPPAWSLSAEWAAYLLFPLLVVPCLFRGTKTAAWLGALAMLSLTALCANRTFGNEPQLSILDITTHRHAVTLARCLPEFTIGMLSFRFSRSKYVRSLYAGGYLNYVLVTSLILLLFVRNSDLIFVLLLPFLIVGLVEVDDHFFTRLLASKLGLILGQLSYSIYLIHIIYGPLIGVFRNRFHGFGSGTAEVLSATVVLLITIATAYLSYKLVEAPCRKLLRNLLEGQPETNGLGSRTT